MVDRFETRLERLFAEAPPYADADAFAARVQSQVQKGRSWRGALVGLAGVVGAVIATAQALNSNLNAAVQGAENAVRAPLSEPVQEAASSSVVGRLWGDLAQALPLNSLNTEVLWIVASLAAAGLALLAVRTFGEA